MEKITSREGDREKSGKSRHEGNRSRGGEGKGREEKKMGKKRKGREIGRRGRRWYGEGKWGKVSGVEGTASAWNYDKGREMEGKRKRKIKKRINE